MADDPVMISRLRLQITSQGVIDKYRGRINSHDLPSNHSNRTFVIDHELVLLLELAQVGLDMLMKGKYDGN